MFTGYYRMGLTGWLLASILALAAPLTSFAALVGSSALYRVPFSAEYLALAVIAALLCYILIRPSVSRAEFASALVIARDVFLAWGGAVAFLLMLGYATKTSAQFSRLALFTWFATTPLLTTAVIVLLRNWLRHVLATSGRARSAMIVGVNAVGKRLAEVIASNPGLGLELKGYCDDRTPDRLGQLTHGQTIGRVGDVPRLVKEERIDVIFVALPISDTRRVRKMLEELKDTTASVYFVPDIFVYDLIQARTDNIGSVPVVALCETPLHGWTGFAKRLTDVVLASMLLLAAAPVMIGIALGIKLTSPGRIIFKQRRYGLDGAEFTVYKFRTMCVCEDGDNVRQATRDDCRVTPIGAILRRFSLDELPQLFNVIQGTMSIVGPRPHAVVHNEMYRRVISGYMMRHKVLPGITGLAQVNGCRGETACLDDMRKRIEYDLEYLRHWSLLLDLRIICRTVAIVLRGEKAY
jgi:putative colanic acid biosynthesis UDP-glucose lipid carrier transferase